MKLSTWASKNGLTYQTAYNLFRKHQLPGNIIQLASGTILIDDDLPPENIPTYIYCRVSSYNKKADLDRQADRCIEFCGNNGWQIEKVIKEIASGMNDKRKKLSSIFDKKPKRIVVEHKDRLTRFGFNYFDKMLPLIGYELVVINRDSEDESDLVKDLVAIITSFCCRLYGLRKGKNKAKKIKKEFSDKVS
jgi:putative resolvase